MGHTVVFSIVMIYFVVLLNTAALEHKVNFVELPVPSCLKSIQTETVPVEKEEHGKRVTQVGAYLICAGSISVLD